MQAKNDRSFPLFEQTARWFERAHAALLGELPCCRGCSHCCVGIFPVTLLDERMIQIGLNTLPDAHRKRIVETAATQVTQLTAAVPQLLTNRFVDHWPEQEYEQVIEKCSAWPCPALESDGRCAIYQFRPLVCRSMGIPSEDEDRIDGACAVQTSVPLIRLSKTFREEENRLARLEAEQLEALRRRQGVEGEEILLPFAFIPEISAQVDSA
ncbi:MAG: YkgJ family cysteine cluster protein [Nitrospira sp.]|nr:YkgJ family cysteine cluster protein [Nitrospira sp.]